jgi:hypothetical protein
MTHFVGILDGSEDSWGYAFPILPAAMAEAAPLRRRSRMPPQRFGNGLNIVEPRERRCRYPVC